MPLPLGSTQLQWGRLFSEAEGLDEDGVRIVLDSKLQWGRLFSEAEGGDKSPRGHCGERASMGPPLFRGGRNYQSKLGRTP